MPQTIEVLDFDGLARKHFAIAPPCRAAQLACSMLAAFALLVIVLAVLLAADDFIHYGFGAFRPPPARNSGMACSRLSNQQEGRPRHE